MDCPLCKGYSELKHIQDQNDEDGCASVGYTQWKCTECDFLIEVGDDEDAFDSYFLSALELLEQAKGEVNEELIIRAEKNFIDFYGEVYSWVTAIEGCL